MATVPHPNPLAVRGEGEGPIAQRWEDEGPTVRAPLSPAGGAEITGLDLSQPLSQQAVAWVREALLDHQFLVFPGQALTREAQYAFTAQFGDVEIHGGGRDGKRREVAHVTTNLGADGKPSARGAAGANYRWHTDKPYYATPPALTTLHAVELPPSGGDTEFANTRLAYEALPEAARQRTAGLRVAFRWDAGLRPGYYASELPPVDHPLVRTHPETGAKALYLGHHAMHVVGLGEAESAALLAELLAHATQPRFVHAHRWRPGDLVMWDNRCLLHRAVANYEMTRYRRLMHRNVVRGTVPV